jgi:D-glucosaminate-6-phosphate ammonia-lyase
MNDLFVELGLRRVINACGYVTALGASPVSDEIVAAVAGILGHNVEMSDLQRAASETIAGWSGSEAGCVTACAASGIAVGIAGAITGDDLAHIERLPHDPGPKNEVIVQKGHCVDFSGNITQMIHITGARPIEIGSVNGCGAYQLAGAITERTAAALYVLSGQAPQGGFIDLATFCRVCHERGVPVILDAATDYDLTPFVAAGADLIVQSGHKRLGGLTAGIVAGKERYVRAAYMQERGIGRAMKVGKEGVVGVIAALKRDSALDHDAVYARERARLDIIVDRLKGVPGLSVTIVPDSTGKPLSRANIHVDPQRAGVNAHVVARRLAEGEPSIKVEDYSSAHGILGIEPTCVCDRDVETICERIAEIVRTGAEGTPPQSTETFDDRRHRLLSTWPRRIPGGPQA